MEVLFVDFGNNLVKIKSKNEISVWSLPTHNATLQIINLDEFSKAAGVIIVCCFGISKSLVKEKDSVSTM